MNSSTASFDPVEIRGASDASAAAVVLEAQRALAGVRSIESSALSANGLLAYAAGIAGLVRLLDGTQVDNAAEIASRSDRRLGSEGLAARHGCGTPAQLIEKVTGVASRTARQQVRVAAQTAGRVTDTGFPLEPLFPGAGVALRPDGVEPRDERLVEQRALRFAPQPNGMLGIGGQLPPAQAAIITAVFDAFLSPRTGPAFPSELGETGETDEPDARSRDQQRADIFTALCEGATKLGLTPKLHGAAPTVLVTITASDLANGAGVGVSPSTRQPLSASAVRQFACDGGIHTVILGTHGEVLELSSTDRFFTTAQRKAMIARDGPTCAHPGCSIPAYWTEAHHVIPASQGGPTTVDNGVLLCWFHHRLLDRGEWTITMEHGRPVFHPPTWLPKRTYLSPRRRT